MVIGTTHDPATPHAWAESLSRSAGDARLLTHDGYGQHGLHLRLLVHHGRRGRLLPPGPAADEGTVCEQS
ncbi:alpha/beta hydrolase [Kocuria rhizophila]|nr:alpha/beta hydrolase [Kocuria rhizophila]